MHDDLVAGVETLDDLAATVQGGDAKLDRPEHHASGADLPDAVLPVDALHRCSRHRADVGKLGGADRHFDQLAHRHSRGPLGKADVHDPFLGHRIAHPVDALDLAWIDSPGIGAQHDLCRLAHPHRAGLALIDARLDPEAAGVDDLEHRLAGDHGGSGFDQPGADHAVDRTHEPGLRPQLADTCNIGQSAVTVALRRGQLAGRSIDGGPGGIGLPG